MSTTTRLRSVSQAREPLLRFRQRHRFDFERDAVEIASATIEAVPEGVRTAYEWSFEVELFAHYARRAIANGFPESPALVARIRAMRAILAGPTLPTMAIDRDYVVQTIERAAAAVEHYRSVLKPRRTGYGRPDNKTRSPSGEAALEDIEAAQAAAVLTLLDTVAPSRPVKASTVRAAIVARLNKPAGRHRKATVTWGTAIEQLLMELGIAASAAAIRKARSRKKGV